MKRIMCVVAGLLFAGNIFAAEAGTTDLVYVTKSGAKYHKAGCRYLALSKIEIPLDQAKEKYSACSVCYGSTDRETNTPKVGTPTGETTKTGKEILVGPRGGKYHYSKSGKKVYEKRK